MSRRTEVDRLSGALECLEKMIAEHADRIDPILRPQGPECGQIAPPANPESRLASLVNRADYICERLAKLTERVEA